MADWYKRDPKAAIDGMIGLSLEEVGAYNLVLDLIYLHQGPIRDDATWLAGLFRCSTRKVGTLLVKLSEAGKIIREDGRISNRRAQFEIEFRASSAEKLVNDRSKAGKLSGEARRARRKNSNLAEQRVEQNEQEKSRVDKRRVDTAKPRVSETDTARDSLFGETDAPETPEPGSLLAEIMRHMESRTIPPDAAELLARWKARGADPDKHILPEVIRITERLRLRGARMPERFAYFDRAVQEAQDRELDDDAKFIAQMNRIVGDMKRVDA